MLIVAMAFVVSVSDSSPEVARRAVTARLEAIQNIAAEYDVVDSFEPKIEAQDAAERRIPLKSGKQRRVCVFRFLRGRAMFQTTAADPPPGLDTGVKFAQHEIVSFTPERVERLSHRTGEKSPMGLISPPSSSGLAEYAIDVALGLRGYRERIWLTSASLADATVTQAEGAETILELRGGGPWTHVWSFDKSQGYALTEYRAVAARGPLKGKPIFETLNADFETIDGVPLPRKIEMRVLTWSESRAEPFETSRLVVTRYDISPDGQDESSFSITWPLGSEVFDQRIGKMFRVKSQPRALDDDSINDLVEQRGQPPIERRGAAALIVAANAAVLAVIAVVYLFRRRRRLGAQA